MDLYTRNERLALEGGGSVMVPGIMDVFRGRAEQWMVWRPGVIRNRMGGSC